MRTAIVLLAATCLATPALAQEREARIADTLNDPAVQDGITLAVAALAGIVLDTRIGSLAPYSDGRIRPGDTLGDLKRREDPGFERRLGHDTRRAVGMAGRVAGDVAAASGAIAETGERLRDALAPLAAAIDARRDDIAPDKD